MNLIYNILIAFEMDEFDILIEFENIQINGPGISKL
jgi:hypothetical protein